MFLTGLLQVKGLKGSTLCADENILYFNEDAGNIVFICNEMGILNTDLHNINLEDTSYDEDDSHTIMLIRLLDLHIKLKPRKELKKR